MTAAPAPTLDELRARVDQMQGRPAAQPVATHPAFTGLLQLQTGSSYGVDSASLAMALMAGPSADGAWCGVVGSAQFGLEAAAAAGVDLRRTILVPDPGEAWLEVTAALIDVLGVVVVAAPRRLRPRTSAASAPGCASAGASSSPMATGRVAMPGCRCEMPSGSGWARATGTCRPAGSRSRSAAARRRPARDSCGCPTGLRSSAGSRNSPPSCGA